MRARPELRELRRRWDTMGTFNCIAEDANATALVNCYKAYCVSACE
jgi:hypothetical protein